MARQELNKVVNAASPPPQARPVEGGIDCSSDSFSLRLLCCLFLPSLRTASSRRWGCERTFVADHPLPSAHSTIQSLLSSSIQHLYPVFVQYHQSAPSPELRQHIRTSRCLPSLERVQRLAHPSDKERARMTADRLRVVVVATVTIDRCSSFSS